MGNPLKNGAAEIAPANKILLTGRIPQDFLDILAKAKAQNSHVESTEINFGGDKWTPTKCKGLENIYGLNQEKEAEQRAERQAQKVGERRPAGKTVNWSEEHSFKPSGKDIDWTARKTMGMADHPFSSPNAVIPRAFRFTVETDLDTKFQHFVKDLEIDWVAKNIRMSLYETIDFDSYEVIEAYTSQKCKLPLTVMLYDGCGNKIMAYRFNDVACHTYSTPLDYASSDVLTAKVVFSYKSVERLKRPTK